MRYSQLFGKTLREPPKQEVSVNAKLLEQSGFITKTMAGVYAYLPLGLRVLQNIMMIIREEMNSLGAQELYLPALQDKALWDRTGRWKDLAEIMYQFKDHSGQDIGLAPTHEEVVASLVSARTLSYRDLPFAMYQIQDKFRDERRAKSGLVRGREFSMKDLYSFHGNQQDCDAYYDRVAEAYRRIFSRVGVQALLIEASGGSFTEQYSHEFQVIADAGEDRLIHCMKCDFAQNIEVAKVKSGDDCPRCGSKLQESKGIEVGNIFKLGTRFSEALKARYTDPQGKERPIVMASYGIGPGRLMATIVEVSYDDKGIIWPAAVTPFHVHVLALHNDEAVRQQAQQFIKKCERAGLSVLYDDRDATPGVKFQDADLIGIPIRAVVSKKTGDSIEIKKRTESSSELLSQEAACERSVKNYR